MRFCTAASGTSFTKTQIFTFASSVGQTCSILPAALTYESIGHRADGPAPSRDAGDRSARCALRHRAADELDDVLGRRARREDLRDAQGLQLGDVVGGDRAADGEDDVVDALLAEQLDDAGHERHVR